jgi:hypothetical protein
LEEAAAVEACEGEAACEEEEEAAGDAIGKGEMVRRTTSRVQT